MSSSLKAVRIEEDDDGTCREIQLEWSIHRISAILSKCKPRQRISSQEFQLYNCSGYNVKGKVILFPKGLDGDAASTDSFKPSLGVELIHIRRSGRVDTSTPIHVKVDCFDADDDRDTRDSLGERTSIEVWRNSGETSPQGPLAIPGAISFQTLQTVRGALVIAISLGFERHDRDAGGDDDMDDSMGGADGDLLVGVKERFSSLQEKMAGLLVSPALRGAVDAGSPHAGGDGAHHDRTPMWEPVFARLFSDGAPDEWREAQQAWLILVHGLCDVPEIFHDRDVDEETEYDAWPRPSPLLVSSAFAWCPPIRRRLMELVPHEMTFSKFWVRLVVAIEKFAVCGPAMGSLHIIFADMRSGSGSAPARALDLCAFALPASATKSYELLQIGTPTIATHAALLDELVSITAHSDDGLRRRALADLVGKLESHDDMWKEQIDAYAASQEAILTLARTVCEQEEWSLPARMCLAQAEHTCANVASNVSELSSDVISSVRALLAALAE